MLPPLVVFVPWRPSGFRRSAAIDSLIRRVTNFAPEQLTARAIFDRDRVLRVRDRDFLFIRSSAASPPTGAAGSIL
jgi:hypothetical protein